MADAVRTLSDQPFQGMEINGEYRGGVHHVYVWRPLINRWVLLKPFYSLAEAKTFTRQESAKREARMRLVSYWAEKVEEIDQGSYVNSWVSGDAQWD